MCIDGTPNMRPMPRGDAETDHQRTSRPRLVSGSSGDPSPPKYLLGHRPFKQGYRA